MKIGLILGLALVSAAGLWLATRPSLTPGGQLPDRGSLGAVTEPARTPFVGSSAPPTGNNPRHDDGGIAAPAAPIRRTAAARPMDRNSLTAAAPHANPETMRPQRFHVVREDETLSQISYEYYGSAGKWRKIFEANRDTVKNANVVRSGTKLVIPYD